MSDSTNNANEKFIAVLQFTKKLKGEVPSIEFDTREQAEIAGKQGIPFYGADKYEIRTVKEGETLVLSDEPNTKDES